MLKVQRKGKQELILFPRSRPQGDPQPKNGWFGTVPISTPKASLGFPSSPNPHVEVFVLLVLYPTQNPNVLLRPHAAPSQQHVSSLT
jgi:hypothetical protein